MLIFGEGLYIYWDGGGYFGEKLFAFQNSLSFCLDRILQGCQEPKKFPTFPIPWLFTDLKTIFTDLKLGKLSNMRTLHLSFFCRPSIFFSSFSIFFRFAQDFKCIAFDFTNKSILFFDSASVASASASLVSSWTILWNKIPWLWQELRFSLTYCKIPWLFPDLEKFLFFPTLYCNWNILLHTRIQHGKIL